MAMNQMDAKPVLNVVPDEYARQIVQVVIGYLRLGSIVAKLVVSDERVSQKIFGR